MPEKKQKIPLTDQVKLPEDLGREINMEASRLGKFKYEVVRDAWQAYTHSGTRAATHSSESAPIGKSHQKLVRQLPDDAVTSITQHWGDADYRECVTATSRVWDVGDPEIKDSLVRNCKTFARSSDMLEALRTSDGSEESQQRIDRILSLPRSGEPKNRRSKGGS